MPGSRARPSIKGSSVVPGLPNMTSTPSCFRISRKACLPEVKGIGGSSQMWSGFGSPRVRATSPHSTPPSLTAPEPDGTLGRDGRTLRVSRRVPAPPDCVHSHLAHASSRALHAGVSRHACALGLSRAVPQSAAEVTLQPVERLGVDAAILFADILLVLEPLGIGLEFTKGDGPHIARP